MKFLGILALSLTLLGGTALAEAPPHHPHHPPPCDLHPRGPHHAVCGFGVVANVTKTGMELHPDKGHPATVVFAPKTVFQTNSGAGALDGIMAGDYACVLGTMHGPALVAKRIFFDQIPFACPQHRPPPKRQSSGSS